MSDDSLCWHYSALCIVQVCIFPFKFSLFSDTLERRFVFLLLCVPLGHACPHVWWTVLWIVHIATTYLWGGTFPLGKQKEGAWYVAAIILRTVYGCVCTWHGRPTPRLALLSHPWPRSLWIELPFSAGLLCCLAYAVAHQGNQDQHSVRN